MHNVTTIDLTTLNTRIKTESISNYYGNNDIRFETKISVYCGYRLSMAYGDIINSSRKNGENTPFIIIMKFAVLRFNGWVTKYNPNECLICFRTFDVELITGDNAVRKFMIDEAIKTIDEN